MYLGLVYNFICLLVSYLASFIIWTNVSNWDEVNEGLAGVVGEVCHCWVAVHLHCLRGIQEGWFIDLVIIFAELILFLLTQIFSNRIFLTHYFL